MALSLTKLTAVIALQRISKWPILLLTTEALTDICICTLQVLITLWNLTPLRNSVKKEGWEYTKEIADEYGHAPPTPRPYEDITIPRGVQQAPASSLGRKEPRPVYSDETSLPEIRYEMDPRGPPPKFSNDGYEADDDARRRRAANSGRDEMEMEDIGGYREIDRQSERTGSAQVYCPLTQTVSGLKKNKHTLKWTRVKRKCINYKELKVPQQTHGCKVI